MYHRVRGAWSDAEYARSRARDRLGEGMAEIYRARRRLQDVWWREAAGQYGDAVVHWDGVILTTNGEWLGQLPSVPVRPSNLEEWLLSLEPEED